MRISDWSSDVCSSDLGVEPSALVPVAGALDKDGASPAHIGCLLRIGRCVPSGIGGPRSALEAEAAIGTNVGRPEQRDAAIGRFVMQECTFAGRDHLTEIGRAHV